MAETGVKLILRQPVYKSTLLINGKVTHFISVNINASCDEILTGKVELLFDEIILEGNFIERKKNHSEHDDLDTAVEADEDDYEVYPKA